MFKIGNLELPDKALCLAPMEDITDPSFRYMCKKFGADILYTEFISSDGLIRDGKKSVQKLNIYDYEKTIGIQIYGHIPEAMEEAAKIVDKTGADIIDINFGCPVKKIANRGAGSGILNNLPLMKDITERIIKSTNKPVTVKTRLGWDSNNLNILEVAKMLQDIGVKAITIHGRTRAQLFKGEADWTLIGEVKNHPDIKIPIIGNGDIKNGQKTDEYFKKYSVDAIMIGRASIGKPWIFKEIKHFIKTGEELPQPNISEKVDIATEHFKKSLEFKETPRAIYEMRRHFNLYFKGIPDFKETRLKLLTCCDENEIFKMLEKIKDFEKE